MWTRFDDMFTCGRAKLNPVRNIYIEAPRKEAVSVFFNRLGRDPRRATCTCCGRDYHISEETTLEEATAPDRRCPVYTSPDGREEVYAEADQWARLEAEGWTPGRFSSKEGYIPLAAYIHRKSVLVVREDEIRPWDLEGYV